MSMSPRALQSTSAARLAASALSWRTQTLLRHQHRPSRAVMMANGFSEACKLPFHRGTIGSARLVMNMGQWH